ncbi:DsrE family protein, partial [Senegalia sp. (in: firmicutes)]
MNDKLVILWTSRDREVALNMVFMYALNAKIHNWWKDLTLIIWGPSSKLLSEDEELQDYISKMKEEGIDIVACKACSNNYGVTEKLE